MIHRLPISLVFTFLVIPAALADSPEDCYKRGTEEYSAGKYDQALQDLSLAIKQDPNYGAAYEHRAYLYQTTGKSPLAIEDLTAAIKYSSETKQYLRVHRAMLYETMGDLKNALEDWNWCIAHHLDQDTEVQYLLARATVLEKLKLTKQAEADLTKVNSILSDHKVGNLSKYVLPALQLHAALCVQTGQYQQALQDCTKVLAEQPKDSYNDEIYRIRGAAYSGLGEDEKALNDFRQAVLTISCGSSADPYEQRKRERRQIANYIEASKCNERLKEFDASIDCLSKVVKLDPDNQQWYLKRAKLFYSIGETKLAKRDEAMAKRLSGTTNEPQH